MILIEVTVKDIWGLYNFKLNGNSIQYASKETFTKFDDFLTKNQNNLDILEKFKPYIDENEFVESFEKKFINNELEIKKFYETGNLNQDEIN